MYHDVFTYGSLKRGLYNHRLLKDATFVGNACTLNRYVLCDGAFPRMASLSQFPAWQRQRMRAFAGNVYGEVFAVNDATLAALDELEGTPTHYRRESLRVNFTPGRGIDAFGYLIADADRLDVSCLMAPNRNNRLAWWPAFDQRRRGQP